ncbi:MAG: alpha/beta hydrolase family protein [Rhodospirillales bacterium]
MNGVFRRLAAAARVLLAAACLAAALPAGAIAQPVLVADGGDAAQRGPAEALGVVIWNHAGDAPRPTDPAPAIFVDVLRRGGFDVFRLDRPPEGDTIRSATLALVEAAQGLRARGYARIVLAGQSAGGWIALLAQATTPDLADVIVATAPAAYGSARMDPERVQKNHGELMRIAGFLRNARIMVFFFDNDDFDPGGRGPALSEALRARNVPHLVIDRPPSIKGHGVGMSSGFARRFGGCILAFATAPELDGLACEKTPPAAVPYRFESVPSVLPRPANDNAPLARFVGGWRGSLDNGDDVMLVVEDGDPAEVHAVFARGRSYARATDQPFTQRRRGQLDVERRRLVFDSPRNLRIEVVPASGNRLRVTVATVERDRVLTGILQRLSR